MLRLWARESRPRATRGSAPHGCRARTGALPDTQLPWLCGWCLTATLACGARAESSDTDLMTTVAPPLDLGNPKDLVMCAP